MKEMFFSAAAQEAVSRFISRVLAIPEEKASEGHNRDMLEQLYNEFGHAMKSSANIPMAEVYLIKQRAQVKRSFDECGDMLELDRCKRQRIEQRVTTRSYSSLPWRIAHAVQYYVSSILGMNKDEPICSESVKNLMKFADRLGQFLDAVDRVHTGRTLAHYNFFSPLIGHLLQGNTLSYKTVQASQIIRLDISPIYLQGCGSCEAWIHFSCEDRMMPLKNFVLSLSLRLSESMDIVGIIHKCLQSLGPHFKSLAEDAMGKLAQLPTQDVICAAAPGHLMRIPGSSSLGMFVVALSLLQKELSVPTPNWPSVPV